MDIPTLIWWDDQSLLLVQPFLPEDLVKTQHRPSCCGRAGGHVELTAPATSPKCTSTIIK